MSGIDGPSGPRPFLPPGTPVDDTRPGDSPVEAPRAFGSGRAVVWEATLAGTSGAAHAALNPEQMEQALERILPQLDRIPRFDRAGVRWDGGPTFEPLGNRPPSLGELSASVRDLRTLLEACNQWPPGAWSATDETVLDHIPRAPGDAPSFRDLVVALFRDGVTYEEQLRIHGQIERLYGEPVALAAWCHARHEAWQEISSDLRFREERGISVVHSPEMEAAFAEKLRAALRQRIDGLIAIDPGGRPLGVRGRFAFDKMAAMYEWHEMIPPDAFCLAVRFAIRGDWQKMFG